MNLDEFETGLARHGAALSDWPEATRGAGEALLATSAEARRAREEMAALAEALAAAEAAPPTAPDALIERVMADAADVAAARAGEKRPRRGGLAARLGALGRAFSFPMLRPAVACAASAAFGLWLGQSAMMAGAAETLIDGEESAADSYAFDIDDGSEDVEYALLPEAETWE